METEPADIRRPRSAPAKPSVPVPVATTPIEPPIPAPQDTPVPVQEEPVKKPRAKRNYTPEQRKAAGDRIRAINAERIAKCRERNEAVILAQEERALLRLKALEKKREYMNTPVAERNSVALDKPVTKTEARELEESKAKPAPAPKSKKSKKEVVVTSSSEESSSSDETSSDEDIPLPPPPPTKKKSTKNATKQTPVNDPKPNPEPSRPKARFF